MAPEGDGLSFSPKELYEANKNEHKEIETRLRRLEVLVALMLVYAFGQGGAAILSRFAG
jgi:hypothetical protein